MATRIERDSQRFRQIARGQVRKNLKQYISRGELIGRQGKNIVSIPVPQVSIPHFRYGGRQVGGVGQGEGKPGQPVAGDPGDGGGEAGNAPGQHILEVDLTFEELAQIMEEALELPRIEPRGSQTVHSEKDRYSGIRRVGPESLRHFKRTYRAALRRQVSTGEYDADRPVIVPIRDDRRYRSWKEVHQPEANAVIILMMDVSGSMGDDQKEIVRIETFWIDTWLRYQYQNLETRYIIHDAKAREVDRHTFFHTRESGGTMISSAYDLCRRMIEEDYPIQEWNVYPFHFSDGDNWGGGDTDKSLKLVEEALLPRANVFCYGQVESYYGSGEFLHALKKQFGGEHEQVILSQIAGRDDILDSIKTFLGEGAMSAARRRGPSRFRTDLSAALLQERDAIRAAALDYGLDFFEVIYEMVDFQQMNEIASYMGFPTRYPHWRWGMAYERMRKSYAYGLHKIYEMVINNDPCYAYLLDSNELVDQKLVMAHVYGHSDFFKNNLWFAPTNRKMMDEMANHATQVRRIVDRIGMEEVERFIDLCLSLENLIDRHGAYRGRPPTAPPAEEQEMRRRRAAPRRLHTERDYMESFINPPELLQSEAEAERAAHEAAAGRFPASPERDVLRFLMLNAPLERWQRDILQIVREEAYYFAPQGMTKIMNEGWASYWHSTIMTRAGVMSDAEVVDYADHHSGTVAMSPQRINPYKIGLELLRDIEERWDRGQFGAEWEACTDARARREWDLQLGLGLEKLFEVRRIYNDVGFIDTFFTEEFCNRHQLFTYHHNERTGRYEIESREFEAVKRKLLFSLTNFGQPEIDVVDANHDNRGALRLRHRYEGVELKIDEARATLENLFQLWQRPVMIESVIDDKPRMLSFDGQDHASVRMK